MFSGPPGTYEIYEVCGWDDDHVQLRHPLMGGGANKKSLAQSQEAGFRVAPMDGVKPREFLSGLAIVAESVHN